MSDGRADSDAADAVAATTAAVTAEEEVAPFPGGGVSVTASGLHLADDYDDEHEKNHHDDEKSHTFRQRRLTYTKHHLQTAAAAAAAAAAALEGLDDSSEDEGGDDKGGEEEENSKKRSAAAAEIGGEEAAVEGKGADASATAATEGKDDEGGERRWGQDGTAEEDGGAATTELTAQQPPRKRAKKLLTPRVLHASAPPKKLRDSQSRLYEHQQSAEMYMPFDAHEDGAAEGEHGGGANEHGDGAAIPQWRRRRFVRHSIKEDAKLLPFPRDVVGTYSCHGVEPLYDSDYEHNDEEEGTSDKSDNSDDEIKGAAPTSRSDNTVAKINQDRGGVAFPYGNCPRTALFAAYDGHGEGGEFVAQYALHEIQRRLERHPDFNGPAATDDGDGGGGGIAKAFKDTFVQVDEDLKDVPEIEPLYAGATACVVLLRERVLTIANAGDSRAVLARRTTNDGGGDRADEGKPDDSTPSSSSNGAAATPASAAAQKKRTPIDLSVDQNPDSPGEQERIEAAGGYVSPPPEPGLSSRVWLDPNFTQIGLAMSRSIGDHAVKPVGVIAEPVVTTHSLTDDDDFMIIATDGVWEFVESEEAVDIVSRHLDAGEGASRACQCLIEAAAAKWHDYEGDYRDDITALVVTFKGIWDHSLVD